MAERIRVQFDFAPDALKRVDAMQEQLGVKTRAEVLRRSLKVLEWLMQSESGDMVEIQRGGQLMQRLPVDMLLK